MKFSISVLSEVPFTKEQKKIIFSHLFMIMAVVVAFQIIHVMTHERMGVAWILSVLFVVFFIIISLLDYLDIIKYRKTVERLNKCSVCKSVYKKGEMKTTSEEVIESVGKSDGKDNNNAKVVTKREMKKDEPLNGLIVSDVLVCENCIKKIEELRGKKD